MERIGTLAQQINIKNTSTGSKPCEQLDSGRVKRIFAIMQATYGSLWVNNVGTNELLAVSFDVWGRKLAGLTDKQIRTGLDNLPEKYPPTPARFYNLCKIYTVASHRPIDKSYLLEKKSDKEHAQKWIRKIRGVLHD